MRRLRIVSGVRRIVSSPSRRTLVLAGVVLIVLLGAGVTVLLVPWTDRTVRPPTAGVVVRTTTDPGETANLQTIVRVLQALPGQLAHGDVSALSSGTAQQFADPKAALPAGATLTVDATSYRRTGAVASVTVTAAAPGTQTTRFSVVLVHENGSWKISGTYPMPGAS
jgi:hypothetical protein